MNHTEIVKEIEQESLVEIPKTFKVDVRYENGKPYYVVWNQATKSFVQVENIGIGRYQYVPNGKSWKNLF